LKINKFGFERSLKKEHLNYETKALPHTPNITHFIGKGACMQQYPKLNPAAYAGHQLSSYFQDQKFISSLPLSSTEYW